MNKLLFVFLPALGLPAVAAAQNDELGRVITATPVIQQYAVPRQVCSNQQVTVQQPNSGAGALMGAVAGGAVGNAIGGGNGRTVATVIGVLGGAITGNNIEGSGTQVQNTTQCTTQTFYENRAVAYNVTYEYAGRQYTVQMPQDPGPTVRLQVTPMGAGAAQSAPSNAPQAAYSAPSTTVIQEVVTVPQVVYAPGYSQVYPAVYPSYYPSYYYRPYYPPAGVSLNFGYSRGWGHHR